MGVMGPGTEWGKTPAERKQDQRQARMEDVNKSTRPGEVTIADLRRKS